MSDSTETQTQNLAAANNACQVILARISEDLGMMLDREFPIRKLETSLENSRPCGQGSVHISFRLGFLDAKARHSVQGAVLIPLADALAMANLLMMAPDAQVAESRLLESPDEATKDSLMEISKLVGASVDAEVRERTQGRWAAGSLGCQGVAADVRPAFDYVEGDGLVVTRARARVGEFEEFTLLMILPDLGA